MRRGVRTFAKIHHMFPEIVRLIVPQTLNFYEWYLKGSPSLVAVRSHIGTDTSPELQLQLKLHFSPQLSALQPSVSLNIRLSGT